jgi:hypothetical protein
MPHGDDLRLHLRPTTVAKPAIALSHYHKGADIRYYASADPEERIYHYTMTFRENGDQVVHISADMENFLKHSDATGFPSMEALLASLESANVPPNPLFETVAHSNSSAYYPSEPQIHIHAIPRLVSLPSSESEALQLHRYIRDTAAAPCRDGYLRQKLIKRFPHLFYTKSAREDLIAARDLDAAAKRKTKPSKPKAVPVPVDPVTSAPVPLPENTDGETNVKRSLWLYERGAIPLSVHLAARESILDALTFVTTLATPDDQYVLPHLFTRHASQPVLREYPVASLPPTNKSSYPAHPFLEHHRSWSAPFYRSDTTIARSRPRYLRNNLNQNPTYTEEFLQYIEWNQGTVRHLKLLFDPLLVINFPYRSALFPVLHFLKNHRLSLVSSYLSHYTSYIPTLQKSVETCHRLNNAQVSRINETNHNLVRHLLMLSRHMGFRSYPQATTVTRPLSESHDV